MSKRAERKREWVKYETLKKYAFLYDIEPRFDYGRPGASPPERAFHLLCCGYDMLVVFMQLAFPSLQRRTFKTGTKWITEGLMWNGAASGGFLARATPTLLALTGGNLDGLVQDDIEPVDDPDLHHFLRRSVEDFYPLILARKAAVQGDVDPLVEACSEEFEVMKTGKPREAVAEGTEPANEYSLALLRGDDPNQNPELVEQQRRYALDYFIYQTAMGATVTSMFDTDAKRLLPKTLPFLDPTDPQHSDYRERAAAAWVEASRPYREYALLEYRNAAPSEKEKWATAGKR